MLRLVRLVFLLLSYRGQFNVLSAGSTDRLMTRVHHRNTKILTTKTSVKANSLSAYLHRNGFDIERVRRCDSQLVDMHLASKSRQDGGIHSTSLRT